MNSGRRQPSFSKGLGSDLVADLRLDLAEVSRDDQQDYGEARFQVRELIKERLYVVVFTRRGDRLRRISLRRANKREQVLWENR